MGTVETGSHGKGDAKGVSLSLDGERLGADEASPDYVAFVSAGEHVKGEFHCSECGYGVIVYRELPICPMCGNATWEQSAWSPFGFARNAPHSERGSRSLH